MLLLVLYLFLLLGLEMFIRMQKLSYETSAISFIIVSGYFFVGF